MSQDDSHLDTLAILHYCVGGLMMLFACLPLLHLFMGLSILLGIGEMSNAIAAQNEGQPAFPTQLFGWFFFAAGLVCFLIGQAISICVILSGRYLHKRTRYMFSFVIACVACIFMPFGTILGIFTIVVLSRESVKDVYGRSV